MPPKEEHEGMERGMRAPDEMMLECLRRAGQVWTWPALRCRMMHRRRAWAGGSELAEGCVALRDGRVVVTREVPGAYREVRKAVVGLPIGRVAVFAVVGAGPELHPVRIAVDDLEVMPEIVGVLVADVDRPHGADEPQ